MAGQVLREYKSRRRGREGVGQNALLKRLLGRVSTSAGVVVGERESRASRSWTPGN